jgi:hypothetical protein
MWWDRSLKFQVTTPLLLRGALLLVAGFLGGAFAADFAPFVLALAGFFLVGFLAATLFFARFITTFSLRLTDEAARLARFGRSGEAPKRRAGATLPIAPTLVVGYLQRTITSRCAPCS